MADAPESGEVTEADREAAADAYAALTRAGDDVDDFEFSIRCGKADGSPYVQAFARHRLAALRTPPAGEQPVGDVGALVERLRQRLRLATPGPWQLQDGCSWRRIGTREHDGNVLCPYNSRSDRHPDLTAGKGEDLYANLELIVEAKNALPTLLAAISSLSAQVAGMREALEVGLQAMGTAERVDWAIRARAAIAGGEDGRG